MKELDQKYIHVGKIGGPYGIKGWLKVYSFTDDPTQILQYHPWYLGNTPTWQAVELETSRPQGNHIVAKLAGIETPEAAKTLSGKIIAVMREQLAPLPPDEFYWTDLEGLTVIDQKGQVLGKIRRMLATGSNDVIVIKNAAGKEYAIPYLPETVVKQVDLNQGVLYVDWDLI